MRSCFINFSYQKPNFFPLRHNDDDDFLFAMLSCCGNSVLQLFKFFFQKAVYDMKNYVK